MRRPKAPKLSLVFDEEKRREHLTGFRKRKLERKLKAKKAAEARLVEEIKAVKQRYREAAKQRLAGIIDISFPDNSLDTVKSSEEKVIEDRTVLVEQIDLSDSHYFLGANKPTTIEEAERAHQTDKFPKMSLKAALKMNPTKKRSRKRNREFSKRPSKRKKTDAKHSR